MLKVAHSREHVAGDYVRGGRTDTEMMRRIAWLMRDRRTDQVAPIDPRLIDLIHDIRLGLSLPPEIPIEIVSGYRSPETNRDLARTDRKVAKNSFHVRGMAADIRIAGVAPRQVQNIAMRMGRGGVAAYNDANYTHIDVGPVRTWNTK